MDECMDLFASSLFNSDHENSYLKHAGVPIRSHQLLKS